MLVAVAAQRVIDAPLFKFRVIDDIGRPGIAEDGSACCIARPIGDRLKDLVIIGRERRRALCVEGGRESHPALHIKGVCRRQLRAEDEVNFGAPVAVLGIDDAVTVGIGDDDGGIVHGDRAARPLLWPRHIDRPADGADVAYKVVRKRGDRLRFDVSIILPVEGDLRGISAYAFRSAGRVGRHFVRDLGRDLLLMPAAIARASESCRSLCIERPSPNGRNIRIIMPFGGTFHRSRIRFFAAVALCRLRAVLRTGRIVV